MDYTKDAILVHEGIKSFEETYETGATVGGSPQHPTEPLSIFTLMNGSDYIERKMAEQDPSSVLLMKANGSLAPSPSPSSLSPFGIPIDANDTLEYIPYSMRPETYIVPFLFAIIFIIGVIGNGTLIVIFIKHRSMRNVPNMFIVSLAIGDLLVILFCVPFTSTVYTVDSWPYGLVVCKFSEFVKDLSVGVSVFTLTALSADRYFAIVDPMRKLTGRRATRITIISIVGIWTLSILVALPSALYSYIRVFPEYEEGEEVDEEDDGRTFQVCYPYPTEFGPTYAQVMVMFHFLVYYAVPLLFIATFYIIMARHLVLSTRNMPGEAQGQAKQIQARKKVAKMILSFVVIFAICFFPHHLFLLFFYFYPDAENSFNAFWNICRIVGFCLSFTNSCINPITLYCVSGTFRKQFNDHLFCCICEESGNRPSRGGRPSGGGTLAGGGGGRSGGLCAACVSLSGNNGQLYGNDSRYGNGSGGRGGNGRFHRGSTSNSDRMMSKRKSTHWETQTTVVNHRVLNEGTIGAGANIHVNLCSEHEHIPLQSITTTMASASGTPHLTSLATTTTQAEGATSVGLKKVYPQQKRNHQETALHSHCHPVGTSAVSSEPPLASDMEGYGRRHFSGNTNNRTARSKQRRPDVSKSASPAGDLQLEEQTRATSFNGNFIEEETSSQLEKYFRNGVQHSPTKSYPTVGDILSKISNKCSPNHHQKHFSPENSTPRKSPVKGISASGDPRRSGSCMGNELERDEENEMNYHNNNNYTDSMKNTSGSSEDECTLTSFIAVPDRDEPLGGNLGGRGNVIICFN